MIVVSVPWVKVDPGKKFLPHWIEWYAANKVRHGLRQHFEIYRPMYAVQEEAVEMALQWEASHVLFVEDDHWGFPIDGLDVLLKEDKDVIGFQTFRKMWPYSSLAMQSSGTPHSLIGRKEDLLAAGLALTPHDRGDGEEVQETHVITWAFTLVKTDVFRRLHDIGLYPFQQQGPVPTDSYFNQYCEDAGIKRHVHFGFGIAHGEHDPEDLPMLRDIERGRRGRVRNQAVMQEMDKEPATPTDEKAAEQMVAEFQGRNPAVMV